MLQSFFQAASKQHADALATGGMLPHGCTTNVVRIEVDSASMYQHGKTEEALGHRSNGMAAALSGASSKLAGTGRCLNLPAGLYTLMRHGSCLARLFLSLCCERYELSCAWLGSTLALAVATKANPFPGYGDTLRPQSVRRQLTGSLLALNRGVADIFYLHAPGRETPHTTRIDGTIVYLCWPNIAPDAYLKEGCA